MNRNDRIRLIKLKMKELDKLPDTMIDMLFALLCM